MLLVGYAESEPGEWSGHLDTTRGFCCCVDLEYIPDGLNAAELEKYVREHGTRPRCT